MKGFLLCLALLGNIVSLCAGYGQSGAAERIMYYAGYLSEEIIGSGYTIAPGCSGSRAGRCTFNEFMQYIWAPFEEKGDTVRPTVTLLDAKTDFATAKLATLLQKMNGYKKAKMAKPITGNIDSGRLFPGSHDYYDAMRKCGSVVEQMRPLFNNMKDGDPQKDTAKNLIGRAKEAANMVVDVRAKEMDNNDIKPRIKDLETRLGFSLATKPGRDSTGRIGAYSVWDPIQSIKNNLDKEGAIIKAWGDWFNDPGDNWSNKRHITAFRSAKMAASSCGC